MSQYIVRTPLNPNYNGKTCGVRFERGRAFVSQHTINPALNYTVEEVIRRMKEDFGYDVTPVEDEVPAVAVETIFAKIPEAPPSPADDPLADLGKVAEGLTRAQAAAALSAEETRKAPRKARGGK